MGSAMDRPGRGVRAGLGGALAAVLVLGSCAPPDRPPGLPPTLPYDALSLLEPRAFTTARVAPGVWYRRLRSRDGPWVVHLLEADLDRCELGLGGARAAEGLARVSDMVGDWSGDTLAAVNGDFFTEESEPGGPELIGGRLRTRTSRARPSLAWRPGSEPRIGPAEPRGDTALVVEGSVLVEGPGEAAGSRELAGSGAAGVTAGGSAAEPRSLVLGGRPELLDGGRRVGDLMTGSNPGFAAHRHPRTAVAFDPDTGRLWMVVVDGRRPGYSVGMTLPELAGLLEALGAEEALNLDGGGSSVMVVRGRPVSRPSDEGGERPVVNALLLLRNPELCTLRAATSP